MEDDIGLQLTMRVAGSEDRDTVLRLPAERWFESDTLREEYMHITSNNDKRGYVCLDHHQLMMGFIAVYMGNGGRDVVLLHKRIAAQGFMAQDILKRLLGFAVQDLTGLTSPENLVLTVPGDSYAIIKNSFLGPCTPLFTRKSLLLRGSMPYVLKQLQKKPPSNLMFLEGEGSFQQLLRNSPYGQNFLRQKLTVRGDPMSLVDFLEHRLPFEGVRPLMTFSRRPGVLGGLSIGTVKMESHSQRHTNVLHIDIHTAHWQTLQEHVIEQLRQWATGWEAISSFYLDINCDESIELRHLICMAGELGLIPRDECAMKTLISLDGQISDIQW